MKDSLLNSNTHSSQKTKITLNRVSIQRFENKDLINVVSL